MSCASPSSPTLCPENAELNNDLAGRITMLGGTQGCAVALAKQHHRLYLGQMQVMPAPRVLCCACLWRRRRRASPSAPPAT
jgi:hypothetical protein